MDEAQEGREGDIVSARAQIAEETVTEHSRHVNA